MVGPTFTRPLPPASAGVGVSCLNQIPSKESNSPPSLLESMTAFHGRVSLELFTSDTPQIWVTAFEAIAGLIIESVFKLLLTFKLFATILSYMSN